MTVRVVKSEVPLEEFLREDNNVDVLEIEIKGVKTSWEYKQLSWFEKNKCVAKATTIIPTDDGATFGFDLATYYSEALMMMLVSAPIPITPTTLKTLKNEIGSLLQTIVPAPMEDGVGEIVKKESEES